MFFVLPFLIGTTSEVLGQNSTDSIPADSLLIQGQVIDSISGELLPFVNIHYLLNEKRMRTFTDFDGKFAIKVPASYRGHLMQLDLQYVTYYNKSVLAMVGADVPLKIKLSFDKDLGGCGFTVPERTFTKDPDAHRMKTIRIDN